MSEYGRAWEKAREAGPEARAKFEAESSGFDEEDGVGGLIEVLDPSGHFEVRWGKKKDEIAHAEETFNDLLKKGYTAFIRTWRGRKGKEVAEFDPKAGVLIFQKKEVSSEPTPDDAPKDAEDQKQLEDKKGPVNAELVDEPEYEQTSKFDKKKDHTLVPPLRGG